MVYQDEVLVGKKHPILLTVNAPKEVRCTQCFGSILMYVILQISDVEGACQGSLGLEPF